jgi:hypothetical protein
MSPSDPGIFDLLTSSYRRLSGENLVPPGNGAAWLYEQAPFAVLAHDGQADPLFVYANQAAQACFEYGWHEIVGLPSRLSALPDARASRQRALDEVARNGISFGYRGRRVAKSGRQFWIEDCTIWQLIAANGSVLGQAAKFPAPAII